MISSQQAVFMLCRNLAMEIMGTDNVYDYLPGTSASYPFIFIGETFSSDAPTKSTIFSNITQSIHIYTDDHRKRRDVNEIALQFMKKVRDEYKYKGFNINIKGMNFRLIADNSTKVPLLHGIIDIDFLVN